MQLLPLRLVLLLSSLRLMRWKSQSWNISFPDLKCEFNFCQSRRGKYSTPWCNVPTREIRCNVDAFFFSNYIFWKLYTCKHMSLDCIHPPYPLSNYLRVSLFPFWSPVHLYSNFMCVLLQHTEIRWCCPCSRRYRVIHLGMVNLQVATSQWKVTLLLPIVSQIEAGPYDLY